MNRPNHAILDLLVARHGAWPVLERESQDGRKRAYWAVAPPDDVPAPFLILILEGEGRVLDAIETGWSGGRNVPWPRQLRGWRWFW